MKIRITDWDSDEETLTKGTDILLEDEFATLQVLVEQEVGSPTKYGYQQPKVSILPEIYTKAVGRKRVRVLDLNQLGDILVITMTLPELEKLYERAQEMLAAGISGPLPIGSPLPTTKE
jgi:hypothetical protein